MNARQHPTCQEREALRTWGPNDRTRIFKEIVSRQPLDHSKCDQCHYHLNATAVRCMTCKKHFCYECDEKFHLTMPFHRRLLCSSKTLKILQPEEFLDSEDSIIKRGMGINFNHSTRDKSLVLYCLQQVFYILFQRCVCSMLCTIQLFQFKLLWINIACSKSSTIHCGSK